MLSVECLQKNSCILILENSSKQMLNLLLIMSGRWECILKGSYGQEKSGFGGPEVRTNNHFDKSQDKPGK